MKLGGAAPRSGDPKAAQPALFELRDDHRPPGERSAAERYLAPSLFTRLENAG